MASSQGVRGGKAAGGSCAALLFRLRSLEPGVGSVPSRIHFMIASRLFFRLVASSGNQSASWFKASSTDLCSVLNPSCDVDDIFAGKKGF